MRTPSIAGFLIVGFAGASLASEPSHWQVSAGAGLECDGAPRAVHLTAGFGYALRPSIVLGVDLGYSSLSLAPAAGGGTNHVSSALASLTLVARPAGRVSPHLLLGYGLGRYDPAWTRAESSRVVALGAGLHVRLRPRLDLFAEARLALIGGISAADGLHLELPVTLGVRLRP
jgi:hypothetical protein